MKYEKIYDNETIIIYNGYPYILERVTDIQPGESAATCYYCDLRDICIKGDGNSKLIELCMPGHVGYNCCFHVDYDYCGYKIGDLIP